MTTRSPRRTLTAHLGDGDDDLVTELLLRRPDLVHPAPPSDLAGLAHRAQEQRSIVAAIASTTLAENRLLQVLVCCRPDVPVSELAAALPEGIGLGDIEEAMSSLEAAALVWRHDGRVHSSGALRQAMPTTLGPPIQVLLQDQPVEYLKGAIAALRGVGQAPAFGASRPRPATGPDGRPPRKADLIEEVESLLVVPGLVDAVLATGDDAATGIATSMAEDRPVIHVDHPMYHSRHAAYYTAEPTYWLFARALLLPVGDGWSAAQPREVGVSLRGGRPVADLALQPPALVTGSVDQAAVDAAAADRAARTVGRLGDLLAAWAVSPVKTLKGGGLGVAALKQVAATLDSDVSEAARLIELANLAGMVETTYVHHGTGRNAIYEYVVVTTAAATAWAALPTARRWAQLAGAWLRAEHWPSATGRKEPGAKGTPVLKYLHAAAADERRREVLDVLASMEPGQATDPDALAAAVYWRRPQPWLRLPVGRPATVIGWIHEEADLLGVVASGSLSSFGRALVGGEGAAAELLLTGALPEPVRTFTLQADLTATAVGALDRDLLVELRLLADQESEGAATTYRFSYQSLRRAIDAGRDADGILAFLEAHATRGVPGPLAYLVTDVARRHGHLQVGTAGSFVVSEDPAVLADACSHKRTRKLTLRLLAPTVAVSPHPAAKVIDGLREAGFLPTGHEGEPPTVSVAPGAVRPPTRSGRDAESSSLGELPERFRPRGGPPTVATLDEESARSVAATIIAGGPADDHPAPSPAVPGPEPGPDQPSANARLEHLLETAYRETRVLAITLGDPTIGEMAEPIILVVTHWDPGRVVGYDLEDGVTTSILTEHIGAVLDLGPLEDFDTSELGPTQPRRRRGPPPRRRRR